MLVSMFMLDVFMNIHIKVHINLYKNYETYNNERKEQVFGSSSKFQIKRFGKQVTDSK